MGFAQFLGVVGKDFLAFFLLEGLGDAVLDVGEGLDVGGAGLDQVVAELGLDGAADLAVLEAFHGVLKGLDHLAGAEGAEVAALFFAGAIAIFLGQGGEVAAFVKLGFEVLDFLFGGGLVGIAGAIGEFGQDVCGVVLGELGGVVVVEFLCVGLGDAGAFVNEVLEGL